MNCLAASHEVSKSWLYQFYRSKLRGNKPEKRLKLFDIRHSLFIAFRIPASQFCHLPSAFPLPTSALRHLFSDFCHQSSVLCPP